MGIKEVRNLKCNSAIEAACTGGKAFGKAFKGNYQHLARVISGKETIREAAKGYRHPGFEAGKAVAKSVRETTKHNAEVIKNIFTK